MAIDNGSWKIVKECKQLSQDKRYRDMIEIETPDFYSSPMKLAIDKRNYKICKILFNPKKIAAYASNPLISVCLNVCKNDS